MKSIARTPSIYQIRHIDSGRVYVGSAIDPQTRCRKHRDKLRHQTHHSIHLQRAWNKYSESAFVFEIIEPVLFVEDLVSREQYWIDTLRAADPHYGFNLSPTAGSPLGVKHSDEVRAQASARNRARLADPAEREKDSAGLRKHYANPAAREKVSARNRARYANPIAREKMSESCRVRFADPVERAKRAEHNRNLHNDPALRAKKSELALARWADPDYRAMMLAAQARGRERKAKKTEE